MHNNDFMSAFGGSFTSALRWHQLDALWEILATKADDNWFIYAIGEPPPEQPVSATDLRRFLDEMSLFLRREHDEEYCGIVYADDLQQPSLIKIYDPHNLGVSCGFSDNPPLPGWVVSRLPPCDLPSTRVLPNNRRRWWRRLFG
ncbi:MAG: hypothetical protein GY753_15920 [Gammaproteobacteria bacterium]|nr:hypothetical protein [Gammaproteobacteria bacterium]